MTTLEQIHSTLTDIAQPYRDTRIHHCQVQVSALAEDRCPLSGTVLDLETLTAVTTALADRIPGGGITFDVQDVQVLRPGRLLTVGTNLTGLYAEPAFLSEMASQLLSGWAVELLLERERWAYVRQADGYLGWTYRPYLTEMPAPDPTHLLCEPVGLLRAAPGTDGALIGRVFGGTAVCVVESQGLWGRLVMAGDVEGWVPAAALRALDSLPSEAVARRRQITEDAARFIGVPYLWGGCTALGIDCSGTAQLVHRLAGVTIPRDADMQYEAGQPVEPPFQPGDLLFFGGDGGSRSITHVGISLGGWRILHSSRARNGVYRDDVQAVEGLRERFVGARTFLDG
jgi:hypothetical protein